LAAGPFEEFNMELMKRGRVQNGTIVFPEGLEFPDGTEVLARIEPVGEARQLPPGQSLAEFLSQPFFGMYAGREDREDSVAWVNREREKWHQRSQRQD
jgi:hypothetical protein